MIYNNNIIRHIIYSLFISVKTSLLYSSIWGCMVTIPKQRTS